MNTIALAPSTALKAIRTIGLAACVVLAGCNDNPNWKNSTPYVRVGGVATGISATGGPVVLTLNGIAGEDLTLTSDGSFVFPLALPIATGYQAVVKSTPSGVSCTLKNDTGTTAGPDVTSIALSCATLYTIGGTVSGATGPVILQLNGANDRTVNSNGSFSFTNTYTTGFNYTVTVSTAPLGQACDVANGKGVTGGNVLNITNVAVTCSTLPFTLRPLPAIYTTGKAINYGPSRAGGPPAGELPTVAQITQDLDLLAAAGYNLIRLFGSDAVSDRVFSTALATHPELKFQAGIFLEGPTSAPACTESVNDAQVAAAVAQANKYANVVAVSVGNETSFAHNQPIQCLATYITKTRLQIKQPVTADDDWSFYAGLTGSGYIPDTIVPLLDFVSIHEYPFSNTGPANCPNSPPNCGNWKTWSQVGVPAGPARAAAMMNDSLAIAKQWFAQVYNYKPAGETMTIGQLRPITIGETGWKATPTRTSDAIEALTGPAVANPVNAKWYLDLLVGNPLVQAPVLPISAWEGSSQGPLKIFYFEAFDEAWKGVDDGWGLWDASRTPRYALCGTSVPSAPTCDAVNFYSGAGYYH